MRLFVEYARLFGRFQRNARLYLINSAISGVTAGILLVLYNLYLVSLGYGADFVGFVLFAGTIGAGLAIFPAGVCVDRFSGKAILIWSNLLIGVAGAGQILLRQPVPLLVSGFAAGVGLAFVLVINAPFLTLNSTPEERPRLFSINISLGLVTLVVGEILGGALPAWFRTIWWLMAPLPSWAAKLLASQPEARSYQLALLFAGIIAVPSLIPLFMMRGTRPSGAGSGADANNSRVTVGTSGISIGQEGEHSNASVPGQEALEGEASVPTLHPLNPRRYEIRHLRKSLLRSPFFSLMLVYALTGLGAGLFIPYFNIYFVKHLGASSVLFGFIDGGANTITALLTLAGPWLAERLGRVNAVALTRLASLPLLLTIGLTGILPLAAGLYLFRQGLMDMAAGVLQVFSMEAVPERYRGLANSSYQAAFQVPWALAAPAGGLIIVHLGYAPIFVLGALCYILTVVTLWVRFCILSAS